MYILSAKKRKVFQNRASVARKKRKLGVAGYRKYKNTTRIAKKRILGGRDHGWCTKCHVKKPKGELTIDHILPISKGGSNKRDNLQMICRRCHDIKDGMKVK